MRLAAFTAIALTIFPAAAGAEGSRASATATTQSAASVAMTAQRGAQAAPAPPSSDSGTAASTSQAIESPGFVSAPSGYANSIVAYPYPQPFVRARTRRSERRDPIYIGGPVPAGVHVETRHNTALLVTGSVLFGSAYLGSMLAGASCSANPRCTTGLGWLFVPFGGPFIALAYPHSNEATGPLVLAGVMQTTSLVFVLAGILLSRQVLVEDLYDGPSSDSRSPQWSLVPSAPGAMAGMTFSLTYY